jgi:hypothetical protein
MCNINNLILISMPEEFFIILMSALIVGRRDIANLKDGKNLIRVLITTVLTAVSIVLLRQILGQQMEVILILQHVIFIALFVVILRMTLLEAIVGLLINLVFYIIIELVDIAIMQIITSVPYKALKSTDLLFIVFTIPERVIQVALAYTLHKLPFALVKLPKHPLMLKKLLKLSFNLVAPFTIITITAKIFVIDLGIDSLKNIILLFVIITVSLGWAVSTLINTRRYMKMLESNHIDSLNNLLVVKTLLEKEDCDIIELKRFVNGAIIEQREGALK